MITKHDELNDSNGRNVQHFTSIERRRDWPPARARCTCGWQDEWTATLLAEQEAEAHRDEVRTPTLSIERKQFPTNALFRWRCSCGRIGVWLEAEEIARRNAQLHSHRPEIGADPSAIEISAP